MRRREFVALIGGAAAWPAISLAQDRVRVIGILETISPELNAANLDALRRGLQDLGRCLGSPRSRLGQGPTHGLDVLPYLGPGF